MAKTAEKTGNSHISDLCTYCFRVIIILYISAATSHVGDASGLSYMASIYSQCICTGYKYFTCDFGKP